MLVALKSHLLRRSPTVASRLSYNRRNLDFNTARLWYSQVGERGGNRKVGPTGLPSLRWKTSRPSCCVTFHYVLAAIFELIYKLSR